MNKDGLLLMWDYNVWANNLVLDAAAQVTPDQLTGPAAVSFGSLRGTLVHILGAERTWRYRCFHGAPPETRPTQEEFEGVAALRDYWQGEQAAMRAHLDGLTDEGVEGAVHYTTLEGVHYEHAVWHLILHVVNHGTQFRGEAGALLAQYGHSPGNIDLTVYLRSLAAGA